MKDKRQGNDLKVAWSIFNQDGEPFRLEGKNVSLYLKNMFGRKELNDFVVTGNIILWTFYGKDQKNSGKYSLEMVINEGEKGMITTDKCDFVNLVSCSCKLQGGEDAPNVEIESIELTSTLEYVAGGGDYDDTALWKELENKVDKEEGKELSSNDYTDEDKAKVDGLEEELAKKAEKSEIPTKMSQLEQDVEIGGTPDWNASEGEEGFIKNRTHYKKERVEVYGLEDVYWDDDNDGYIYSFSIEVERNKEIKRISFSYIDKESEDIIISDTEIDFETSIEVNSKDSYDFQGSISIEDYGKYKRIHITAHSFSECSGLKANIKDLTLVQLSEEYIPESIARKSEITELSAEVSGLSERVDALGEGASDIFKAIYGETTIEEVTEAYNAGKVIHCDYDGRCYILSAFNSGQAFFTSLSANHSTRLELKQDSRWAISYFQMEVVSNKTKTINESSTDNQYPSAKAVYDAIQQSGGGGASSDKQGVVSQTLNYNSADNTYSVSNVVRGSIPSFFIDLVTEAGASFNAESGYFSLNGIDNIAYDEMRQIYNCRTGYGVNSLLAVYCNTYTARTNFATFRGFGVSYANHQPTTFYTKYLCARNASITKFVIHNEGVPLCVRADSVNNFEGLGAGVAPMQRSRLEEIIGIIDVANLTGSANFFYNGIYQPWLTTFYLKSLKASIDLSGMPRLSEATILYMINNEKATAAITIKLHADAKAMADASEAIQTALANHANITLGV